MIDNPLQFAVVREDPAIELAVLNRCLRRRVLLVASGGCTALTLAAAGATVALVDPNQAQLDLTERKRQALADPQCDRTRAFGVGKDDPSSLSGGGNFESLFRIFRAVLDDLVLPYDARRHALREGDRAALEAMTKSKYWPAAFAATFCDPLLEAMFGPAATQHAERGSYPGYFQRRIEAAIAKPDVAQNYFMHHVLLGHWLGSALPPYLHANGPPAPFASERATMADAKTFESFDLISLSNIFDWMDRDAVAKTARRIANEADSGAYVLIRQLNNRAPVQASFGAAFTFEEATMEERSAFYERILIGRKA